MNDTIKPEPWVGTVTVKVEATFIYVVDEDWEARDLFDATKLVNRELGEYLGQAYNRFSLTVNVKEGLSGRDDG